LRSVSLEGSLDVLSGTARAVAVVVGVAVLVGCQFLFGALRPTDGPGILKFEFVWTPERATKIFKTSWEKDPQARSKIRTALWVDTVVFVPAYVTVFTVLCLATSSTARGRGMANLTEVLAFGSLVAGLLDIVENVALLRVLANLDAPGRWTYVATALAVAKFVLLAFVVVSVSVLGIWWVRMRVSA